MGPAEQTQNQPQPTDPHSAQFSSEDRCTLKLCRSKYDTVGGSRSKIGLYSDESVERTYTWDSAKGEWSVDTVMLGLSKHGKSYFRASKDRDAELSRKPLNSEERNGELSRRELDKVMRATLLGDGTSPPSELIRVLEQVTGTSFDPTHLTISSPIPLYHNSGAFKHVYLALQLLVPTSDHSAVIREIPLALKIAQKAGAITQAEIDYHRDLGQAQPANRHRIISNMLFATDLERFPILNMPGQILTLESFESGLMVQDLANAPTHLPASLAVTRCMLKLADLAVSAGKGRRAHSATEYRSSRQLSGLRVALPSDINDRNFIITPNGRAILIDVGEFTPVHSAPDLFLRIIDHHWRAKFALGKERSTKMIMSLAPFFGQIEEYYGDELGKLFLSELAIALMFARGVDHQQIKQRFPQLQVDTIGKHLAETFNPPTASHRLFISTAVREARHFARQLNTAPEHEWAQDYINATAIICNFSDRELSLIGNELDRYLENSRSRAKELLLESDEGFKKRLGRKYADKVLPWRDQISAGDISQRAPYMDLVRGALFFSPFPDPAVIALAELTARLRPMRHSSQVIRTTDDWLGLGIRLLDTARAFRPTFPNTEFTEALADLMSHKMAGYIDFCGRYFHKHPSYVSEKLVHFYEQYVGMLFALQLIYDKVGPEDFSRLKDSKHDESWKSVWNHLLGNSIETTLACFSTHFPEFMGKGSYQFSKESFGELQQAAELLRSIMVRRATRRRRERTPKPWKHGRH